MAPADAIAARATSADQRRSVLDFIGSFPAGGISAFFVFDKEADRLDPA
jgi:hypothetical protein